MFIDATIMCRNLADLNREGIVALPIHDSVIVQAKYESRAFEIMERNLALKSGPKDSQKSAHKSASQVLDKLPQKEAPDLIPDLNPDLHNGHSGAGRVVVVSPLVPSWVVSLPSDLAALVVVAWFYADGIVGGARWPVTTSGSVKQPAPSVADDLSIPDFLKREPAAISESPDGILEAAE